MARHSRLLNLGMAAVFLFAPVLAIAASITLYFPPEWKDKAPQAKSIAEALAKESGLDIQPRIAKGYPEILAAFSENQPTLTYAGSFVQAILFARDLSVPIVQGVDGKELYSGVMIVPATAGSDPQAIIKNAGPAVAFAKGASSGEAAAKAASGGKAEVATNNHAAAVNAVKAGKAKAAFVKNWWWEANQAKYEGMTKFEYPNVSDHKNSDNVLSANKAVGPDEITKVREATAKSASVFGTQSFRNFDPQLLEPSLDLMRQGGIDPKSYAW